MALHHLGQLRIADQAAHAGAVEPLLVGLPEDAVGGQQQLRVALRVERGQAAAQLGVGGAIGQAGQRARERRHLAQLSGQLHAEVAAVATERLVGSLAGERHRHGRLHQLGHEAHGQGAGGTHRLLEREQRVGQPLQILVGAHHHGLVLGAEQAGGLARLRDLVGAGAAALEAHREGAHVRRVLRPPRRRSPPSPRRRSASRRSAGRSSSGAPPRARTRPSTRPPAGRCRCGWDAGRRSSSGSRARRSRPP